MECTRHDNRVIVRDLVTSQPYPMADIVPPGKAIAEVWTVIPGKLEGIETAPLVHRHTALWEDYVHDWSDVLGHFRYFSRAYDKGDLANIVIVLKDKKS